MTMDVLSTGQIFECCLAKNVPKQEIQVYSASNIGLDTENLCSKHKIQVRKQFKKLKLKNMKVNSNPRCVNKQFIYMVTDECQQNMTQLEGWLYVSRTGVWSNRERVSLPTLCEIRSQLFSHSSMSSRFILAGFSPRNKHTYQQQLCWIYKL